MFNNINKIILIKMKLNVININTKDSIIEYYLIMKLLLIMGSRGLKIRNQRFK